MGTLLLLDIPKVPSDSTIQELLKSVFGMLGMKNLTRLDSDHMCWGLTSGRQPGWLTIFCQPI